MSEQINDEHSTDCLARMTDTQPLTVRFRVLNSCGDCAYLSDDYEDLKAHVDREWHQRVMDVGLQAALDSEPVRDAIRAVAMFRLGQKP
jgi:hypothetical protein